MSPRAADEQERDAPGYAACFEKIQLDQCKEFTHYFPMHNLSHVLAQYKKALRRAQLRKQRQAKPPKPVRANNQKKPSILSK